MTRSGVGEAIRGEAAGGDGGGGDTGSGDTGGAGAGGFAGSGCAAARGWTRGSTGSRGSTGGASGLGWTTGTSTAAALDRASAGREATGRGWRAAVTTQTRATLATPSETISATCRSCRRRTAARSRSYSFRHSRYWSRRSRSSEPGSFASLTGSSSLRWTPRSGRLFGIEPLVRAVQSRCLAGIRSSARISITGERDGDAPAGAPLSAAADPVRRDQPEPHVGAGRSSLRRAGQSVLPAAARRRAGA